MAAALPGTLVPRSFLAVKNLRLSSKTSVSVPLLALSAFTRLSLAVQGLLI